MISPLEIFIFTKVASTLTFTICLFLIFCFFILINERRKSFALVVSSIALYTSVFVAKEYFQFARPLDPLIYVSGYAFPSGHAAGIIFLAIIVTFLAWHYRLYYRYSVLFGSVLITGVVSYSRIYLHVHTWYQVFFGLIFGMVCGWLFIYLSKRK